MTQFATERAALSSLFPRGRFTRDEEGACILTAKLARRSKDFAYVQDPGHKLGIFYTGNGRAYRKALNGLILDQIEADGEGLFHVAWVPEVAERLPWFSRRRVVKPEGGWNFKKAQVANSFGVSEGSSKQRDMGEGAPGSQEVTT
jgi:hypothetical protein